MLAADQADFIGVGRAWLANPDLAERWQKDAGTTLSSMPRDAETAERHRSVRQMALDAIAVSRPRA